jgi:hypothetical protein
MLRSGFESLRTRTLGKFGRSFESRPTRTSGAIGVGSRTALGTLRPTLSTLTATIRVASFAVSAIIPIAPWTALVGALGELLSHGLERLVVTEDLKGFDLVDLRSALDDRKDLDAIDVEFGIDLHDISGLGAGRKNRTIEDTFGLTSASGSPCPGAVGARTRQLDLDPAGHGS